MRLLGGSLGRVDLLEIGLIAIGIGLAAAAGPLTAFILVKHGHVGGTTQALAERDLALRELNAKANVEIAERKLKMEEARFEQEQRERERKIERSGLAGRTDRFVNVER